MRPALAPVSAQRAFVQSIVVEVPNPKTAIVDLTFSAVDIVCVVCASAVVAKLQRPRRSQQIMQRIGGSILVAHGARLAFQDRQGPQRVMISTAR